MVGDIQLHHIAAQGGEPVGLGAHDHVRLHRRSAGRRVALHAVDFHQADTAGTKGFERVSGAQPRHLDARLCSSAHHRGACGHGHRPAINGQTHRRATGAHRGAVTSSVRKTATSHHPPGERPRVLPPHEKSPGNQASALRTGCGVMPPSAHKEAASMVSHKSRNSAISCAGDSRDDAVHDFHPAH